MSDIKILDCTLRDGGYMNNWEFGFENSKKIISLLLKSKIDYIETGFLTKEKTSKNQTLFNSVDEINRILPQNCDRSKFFAMIKFGGFPLKYLPEAQNSSVLGLRVIFKKNQKDEAMKYCRKVKSKGYKLFINPTFIFQYSNFEYEELLKEVQTIKPYGFCLTDSTGSMKENDILNLYKIIENNLTSDIALCFHSHNNLELSFSNAKCLIEICKNRELIIDSTVSGIGRGAGNLSCEAITEFLNKSCNLQYDISSITETADKYIRPILLKNSRDYSIPYHLSAVSNCHPDYAKFLSDRNVSLKKIGSVLEKMPDSKKAGFDYEFINELYQKL